MRMSLVSVAGLLVGCTSDAPPPSCQQAIQHWYSVGCVFIDPNTSMVIPANTFIGSCQSAAASTPSNCTADLDAWLTCTDEVKGGTSAGCDCTVEYMALETCH